MNRLFYLAACVALLLNCGTVAIDVAGAPAKPSTASSMELKFNGHACTVDAPAGFQMIQKDSEVGRLFMFTDPTKAKTDMAAMTIAIVPTSNDSNQTEFLEGFLSPFKNGLKNYKEVANASSTIGGHQFQSRDFSGNFPQGTPVKGFVYVTTDKGAHFLMSASANGPGGAQALPALQKMAKSFRKAP